MRRLAINLVQRSSSIWTLKLGGGARAFVQTYCQLDLKKPVLHMEKDRKRKRNGGVPTHKPPFGDLWSLMWRWHLSHAAVAGTSYDRCQRRDAEGGGDKENTQLRRGRSGR